MSYRPPPPAWGAPAAGPAPGPAPIRLREHASGTTILVLGFLGLFPLCFPLGLVAWILGNKAVKEIDVDRWSYGNRGSVVVGRLLGAVGTVVSILAILLFVAAAVAVSDGTTVKEKEGSLGQGGQVGPAAVQPHADLADPLGPPAA